MYPKPDRSGYQPNFTKSEENDKLDLGWNEGVWSDGHPFRMEVWCWDQTTNVTFFVSRDNLPDRPREAWADLLEQEGLVQFGTHGQRSAYAVAVEDDRGQPVWSINVMVGIDDDLLVDGTIPFVRYESRPAT